MWWLNPAIGPCYFLNWHSQCSFGDDVESVDWNLNFVPQNVYLSLILILLDLVTGQLVTLCWVSLGWCWQWCMTNDQLISWLPAAQRLPTLPILLSFRHKTIDQSLSSTNYLGLHCTIYLQRHRPQCQLLGQNLSRSLPVVVWKYSMSLVIFLLLTPTCQEKTSGVWVSPAWVNDDKLPVPEPNLSSLFRNEKSHQMLVCPLLTNPFLFGFF